MNESWIQILSLFLANAGLIIWFRAESRNDWRHMDNKLEDHRRENNSLIRETQSLIKAIQEEMKDFHCRLFSLEERNKNKKE